MKFDGLQIVSVDPLRRYKAALPKGLAKRFSALRESPLSTKSFSFYSSVSAIASSRIEGEQMEMDSYIKHRMLKIQYLPDLVQKPDDLYAAYRYAQTRRLTEKNFLQAHTKLSAHLLPPRARGALRRTEMVILESGTNRIRYEAAEASRVEALFEALWKDILTLGRADLSAVEAFFFASSIHLEFVKIHPFEDGNGRAGRLLEKWFLAETLGARSWYLQSELFYYRNVKRYYENLNRMGLFYDRQNRSKALPFLLMLPKALTLK